MHRTCPQQTNTQSKGGQLTLSARRALSSYSQPTAIVNARWHIQADLLCAPHPTIPPTRIARESDGVHNAGMERGSLPVIDATFLFI
ncbi:MAG: hypothetical protein FRX49_12351 [Trebouxia sp. A1-2]|nr:MAG: hypothetical protein FRX49_12351 [Trebouxia sp. A1-2]